MNIKALSYNLGKKKYFYMGVWGNMIIKNERGVFYEIRFRKY